MKTNQLTPNEKIFTAEIITKCDIKDVKSYLKREWFDQDAESRNLTIKQVKRCFESAIMSMQN